MNVKINKGHECEVHCENKMKMDMIWNRNNRIDPMSTRLDTEQCVTRRLTNGKSQSKVNYKTESRKTTGRRIKTEINEKQNQSVIKHLLWGGGGGLKMVLRVRNPRPMFCC